MRRTLLVLLLGGLAIYPVHGAGSIDARVQGVSGTRRPPSAAEKASHGMVEQRCFLRREAGCKPEGRPHLLEGEAWTHPSSRLPSAASRSTTSIEIPAEYDPAKKWPLRVQLHGGVGRLPARRPAAAVSAHPRRAADLHRAAGATGKRRGGTPRRWTTFSACSTS